jgi:lipopolysaccharide/colanic/teichoic acid biosynthesis glycosyltransferase
MERTQQRQYPALLADRAAPTPRERGSRGFAAAGGALDVVDMVEVVDAAELALGPAGSAIEARFTQAVREFGDVAYSRAYRVSKRLLDLVVAGLGLLLLSPLLLLLALLVRLDSPGPALFVQPRVGARGRLFPMLKFRTMRVPDGAARPPLPLAGPHKRPDDARVTRLGLLLRRTSLDELPQLVNVLAGQMSLVGPRPELPAIVLARYAPWQYRRLLVPQGMTGWWQVTGRGRKLLHEHTADDLYYLGHAGLGLDLRILARTVGAVLRRDGAF